MSGHSIKAEVLALCPTAYSMPMDTLTGWRVYDGEGNLLGENGYAVNAWRKALETLCARQVNVVAVTDVDEAIERHIVGFDAEGTVYQLATGELVAGGDWKEPVKPHYSPAIVNFRAYLFGSTSIIAIRNWLIADMSLGRGSIP